MSELKLKYRIIKCVQWHRTKMVCVCKTLFTATIKQNWENMLEHHWCTDILHSAGSSLDLQWQSKSLWVRHRLLCPDWLHWLHLWRCGLQKDPCSYCCSASPFPKLLTPFLFFSFCRCLVSGGKKVSKRETAQIHLPVKLAIDELTTDFFTRSTL